MSNIPDPFREHRKQTGSLECEFQGENVPMILRHEDVRKAAKDWKTFSSDAPFRVPIPSEEGVRSMRQLPIETDPPDHTAYRDIVEPFFRRAKDPAVVSRVECLVDELLSTALAMESIEVVREFALPLQSRALTLSCSTCPKPPRRPGSAGEPMSSVTGVLGEQKGAALEAYLRSQSRPLPCRTRERIFSAH